MIVKADDAADEGRIGCVQLGQKLSEMLRKCHDRPGYVSKPAP